MNKCFYIDGNVTKVRTYLDVVPERIKEHLSRNWGDRKSETFGAAGPLGLKLNTGSSFNKVITFVLEPGYYHLNSTMISVKDISNHDEVRSKVYETIKRMAHLELEKGCIPLVASNICDWDSAYAKNAGANLILPDAIIQACIDNNIVLTGGETANLGDQLRKSGMSWMFTLLSIFDGTPDLSVSGNAHYDSAMDSALQETFQHIADTEKFEIVNLNGTPLLHVKKKSRFMMTADGTGSKSIICELVDERNDILDTLAMGGDDSPRDGAFPVLASTGVHAENPNGKKQIIRNMIRAGKTYQIPLVGSDYHVSEDVYTYTMNGVILSEIRKGNRVGTEILPGLSLVLLYEEQRSNGITLQRRILEETFGAEWYKVKVGDAVAKLCHELKTDYSEITMFSSDKTLGELVSQPSTPYFRADSLMPKSLLRAVKMRINVSSGGITGKTRRALEPFNLGADYFDLFRAPELTLILQMASRIGLAKGIIPDEVAYYTWGCGNGAIVGTTCPAQVVDYYAKHGISAKIGGIIIDSPEIRIGSKAFDSIQKGTSYVLIHKYTDEPLG